MALLDIPLDSITEANLRRLITRGPRSRSISIAALLGHAAHGVTQGYVHIDEALKLAASRICEEIAGLLAGEEPAADKLAA